MARAFPLKGFGPKPAPADTRTGSTPPAARRLFYAIAALGFLALLCAPFFADLIDHDAPEARAGVIDYSRYGPLNAPVRLSGDWRMVWLGGNPDGPAAGTRGLVKAPGGWTGQRLAGARLPERGVAAYQLILRGLEPGKYTLRVPILYEAVRVSVNGEVVSQRGTIGLTPQTTRYNVRAQEIPLVVDGGDLRLQVELASLLHRDNGMESTPVLGLTEPMTRYTTLRWASGFLFVTASLVLATYGLLIFMFRSRDRPSFLIGLACLFLLPLAAIFSHDNLVLVAFPAMGLTTMLALQYLSGLSALALFFAYGHTLFPRESSRLLFWLIEGLFVFAFLAHVVALLVGDTLLASELSQMVLALRLATFLYMVGIVITASFRKRDGALVFLLGIGVFAAALGYYDLMTNGVIPQARGGVDVPATGILVLLFSHIVILAERWSLSIDAAEQTADDLRRLLDVNAAITSEMELEMLLAQIVRVTSRIIHADRSTLFLHDPKTGELWSLVAEGVETRQIRIPHDRGLAGACFTSGEAMNIRSAYDDPRFNREVDEETGYRTASVLSVPVTARDGRRLGVMQALNRQGHPAFTDSDLERMGAFAAQAAIAIDNATLFAEVASERNYNESILRSMSTGVITLDSERQVAKLNEAACRILGVPAEQLQSADGRALLADSNPWLFDEIDAVSRSGQPKALLDADVRTGRGDTISANLSIVPLVNEGEAVGVLILIEDITQANRLQGAMRRFMSQEVVDQVLAHDDLLFGDACRASVLFADLRNFTALAERLTPRETVETLNEIYTELFEAVAASDGLLDKFLGDAIMAHWGAPIAGERDPDNAVAAAVQMLQLVDKLNQRRRARGWSDVRLGIGVATGEVVAGAIGSPKRMDYTVIGDSVNLASRLQETTKVYGAAIAVCEATATAIAGGPHPTRELDLIRVRGRSQPVRVFEVLTRPPVAAALEAYAQGRMRLRERRWKDAVAAFETAVAADPADQPAALMLQRARVLAANPRPISWDGIWGDLQAAE